MKKVMVFGTFDIFHEGHKHMLAEAKALGDYLVVVVGRDETIKQVKGKFPTNNQDQRREVIEASGVADKVRLGSAGDKHAVIAEEKPDIIALGYDQKFFLEGLEKWGAQIVRLRPFEPDKYKSSLLQ